MPVQILRTIFGYVDNGESLLSKWTLSGDSPWTWVQHGVIASCAPPLVSALTGGGLGWTATVSGALFAVFVGREIGDYRRKDEWSDKWRRDLVGDLVGPATATLCYLFAWIIT